MVGRGPSLLNIKNGVSSIRSHKEGKNVNKDTTGSTQMEKLMEKKKERNGKNGYTL